MPYEPTRDEIEALRREMEREWLDARLYNGPDRARWILSRFVRREEHERVVARCATCSACTPDATPKGDGYDDCRCNMFDLHGKLECPIHDGSRANEGVSGAGERGVTPESMSLLEHHCSDADFAAIGKMRDESYAAGYSAGRDDAARLNVQQVSHVVELGSETLRALVAAIIGAGGKDWHVVEDAIDATDHLLTHLCEKETTR